jgi:hypothetical protein
MSVASDLHDMVRKNIHKSGQHLFGVFDPDGEQPPFVYTIGNAMHGLPELIIVGHFDANVVGHILNIVGEQMRKSGEPLPETVDIGGKLPIRVREASEAAKAEWTCQVGPYIGREDYRVQQLLLCDPEGVFPGEAGINPGYDVPLI